MAELQGAEREAALASLIVLSGLRGLSKIVEQESGKVPITEDFRNHDLLGETWGRGYDAGEHEGEFRLIKRQIAKRFGSLPDWAAQRLYSSSSETEERIGSSPDRNNN